VSVAKFAQLIKYITLRSWDAQVYHKFGGVEYTGVDDTRLFVWPGKGLFAITGRKSEVHSGNPVECGRYNWMMYLVQVSTGGYICAK
jgi:hypothetical protein